MRYVDTPKVMEIIRGHPDITAIELTAHAYPQYKPGSSDFRMARLRVYRQIQSLKTHGRIYRTGTVPGTKDTGIWRAVQ